MLARVLIFVGLASATASAEAPREVEVHASCATALARQPVHVHTLRAELTQALAGTRASDAYTLDVSLVRLDVRAAGRNIEVRAEVRALLSDERGRIVWNSTARSTARGTAKDRELLQRDAVMSAARNVARSVRAQTGLPRNA